MIWPGSALACLARTLPQTVDAETHEVIHEVVAGCDGVENSADTLLTLLRADLLVAEGVLQVLV